MPLNKRVLEFPFGFGQNEGSHEIPLDGPAVLALSNARIRKAGGVETRLGYTSAADSGTQSLRLLGYRGVPHSVEHDTSDDENAPCRLYALNNGRLDQQGGESIACALSEATVYDRVPISRDLLSETDASDGGIDVAGECEQKNPDFAVDAATNLMVIAWQQRREQTIGSVGDAGVYAEVRDATTMAVVSPAICVSSAETVDCQNPRCINHDGEFLVLFDTSSNGEIKAKRYDQATRAWIVNTDDIVTDLNTSSQFWDAVELTGAEDTAWFLAYRDTTPRVNLARVVGTTVGTTDNIAEVPRVISLHAEGSNLWVGWYVEATRLLRFAVRNSTTLASTVAATTAFDAAGLEHVHNVGIVEYNPTSALMTWSHSGSTTRRCRSGYVAIPVVGTPCHKNAVTLVSRPIAVNGVAYANVLYDGNSEFLPPGDPIGRTSDGFTSVFTVALNALGGLFSGTPARSWRVVAPWLYGTAGGRRDQSTLGRFAKLADDPADATRAGIYAFAATQETALRTTIAADTPFQLGANGIDLCRMQFDASDRFKAVEFGPNLVMAGGVTSVFDGTRVTEYGFWWPPENSEVTENTGSGNLSAGTYAFAACYEARLATGDMVKSPPAIIRSSTGESNIEIASGNYGDIVAQHCSLTQRFDPTALVTEMRAAARITFYRTEANGDIFYEDPVEVNTSAGTYSLANDPFALEGDDFISGDGASDADSEILSNPALYTTGGALPNYPAPATDDLVVHRGRLWGISSEDKRELVFTHYKEAGELPGFHPFLSLRIDDGGDCVGLASLDEKLVVFKRDSVYVVHGDGPNRQGVGGTFQIVRVHTEHGCRDRRSIVAIPQGIMFASRAGICLLGRGLQVEYVGGPVEDTESGKEYVSAVALSDEEYVYFQVRNHARTTGNVLVYHWNSGQWAVDTVTHSVSTQVPSAAAYVDGTYYAAFHGDDDVYEHSGYADCDANWIAMSLATPWLKLGGMQGYGRCWWASVIGERVSAHGVTMLTAANYETTNQTTVWSEADVTALPGRYQPKIHVAQQVGQAFRFTFTTTAPAGAAASYGGAAVWNGLALEVGMKGGLMRRPAGGMKG